MNWKGEKIDKGMDKKVARKREKERKPNEKVITGEGEGWRGELG